MGFVRNGYHGSLLKQIGMWSGFNMPEVEKTLKSKVAFVSKSHLDKFLYITNSTHSLQIGI